MLAALLACVSLARSTVINIDAHGALAGDSSRPAIVANQAALIKALTLAQPGDTVLVAKGSSYYILGGIQAQALKNVTIRIEGTLIMDNNRTGWPHDTRAGKISALTFFTVVNSQFVTLTGGGTGLIDGQGMVWWDATVTGESHIERPNMIEIRQSTDVTIESLTLQNSPRYHLHFDYCARVIVRYITVDVDRFSQRALKAVAHAQRIAALGGAWPLLATRVARHLGRLDRRPFDSGESWKDWLLDQAVKLLPHWVLQPEDLNTDGIVTVAKLEPRARAMSNCRPEPMTKRHSSPLV